RPQHDYFGLRYVSDAYFNLGDFAAAAAAYRKNIETLKADPKAVPPANLSGETNYVRLREIAALRQASEFTKALELAEGFLAEAQAAAAGKFVLRQQTEKARVLEAWAAADPAKINAALAQWSLIDRTLRPLRTKPVEYFEARLGQAWCLAKQGKKDDARKLLQGTMAINPTVGGAEMKGRFEAFLKTL
ncbi:MAG TPA: hypothetical protein VNC50_23130, partial [Planctomycetia bacterium]|nr:hypothetical protein [Planctomycetia bacterium]